MLCNAGDKKISELEVKCANMVRGCEWEGTVFSLDDHMIDCELSLVVCPNKCDEHNSLPTTTITKKDLQQHLLSECTLRNIVCSFCGMEDEYQYIISDHYEECDKMVVSCTNIHCSEQMERSDLRKHLKSCDHSEVRCKYDDLGCSLKRARIDMEEHENQEDESHLAAASDIIADLNVEVQKLKDKIQAMKCQNNKALIIAEPLTVNVKVNLTSFYSLNNKTTFYTSPAGYRMSLCIYPNGKDASSRNYISVFVWLEKGYYDDQLDWPFKKSIKLEILNQNGNYHHYSKTLNFPKGLFANSGRGCPKFMSHDELKRESSAIYLKNNTIYFRLTILYDKSWLICNC